MMRFMESCSYAVRWASPTKPKLLWWAVPTLQCDTPRTDLDEYQPPYTYSQSFSH